MRTAVGLHFAYEKLRWVVFVFLHVTVPFPANLGVALNL